MCSDGSPAPPTSVYRMLTMGNSIPVVLLAIQHGCLGIRSLGREGVPVQSVHDDSREPAAHSRFLRGSFGWDFFSVSAADSVAFLLEIAGEIDRKSILLTASNWVLLGIVDNVALACAVYETAREEFRPALPRCGTKRCGFRSAGVKPA